jgi:hypothetical protein
MSTKCCLKILGIIFLITFNSCELDRKEKELQQWENNLNQKEQELILREKILELKEEELSKKSAYLDSTSKNDSMPMYDTALIGRWDVKMVCIEATCPGSAVGDTKTEQWVISMEGTNFIAKAISGENLARVYSGIYTGNTLELIAQVEQASDQPAAKMVARLHIVNPKRMEGQREITRENNCKIIYTLEMNKQ